MKIRRARRDDALAVARLHVDSWRAAYRGLVPDSRLDRLDPERRAEQLRKMIDEDVAETYVGEAGGEIVGFLTVGACRDDDLDGALTGEIWGIYLAPEHWRKGFGRRLCRHGEAIVRSAGRSVCVLWVFAGNEGARRFYEAMGYGPTAPPRSSRSTRHSRWSATEKTSDRPGPRASDRRRTSP